MHIVRLKPVNPQRGHKLRSLLDSANQGKRYTEGHLYEVTAAEAAHLAEFMQDGTLVDVNVQVHGKERAMDVWNSREAAKAALDEEGRGALLQGSNKIFKAPDRNAAEMPVAVNETEINAETRNGEKRTFRGPAGVPPVRAVSKTESGEADPADDASFFDKDAKLTPKQRADASIARAQQRRRAG